MRQAEYIWLDGETPTQQVRSKARIVNVEEIVSFDPDAYPHWGFDGSSTYQASGHDSDLILHPVRVVQDPIRSGSARLVLCEVLRPDGTPHETNTRANLRMLLENGAAKQEPWVGFEQEYTLFAGNRPFGFPADGSNPKPQGPFYCGVGADRIFGRDFVEAHTQACIDAGLMIYGINAEVMPGQWEFQIGYRGVEHESADVLNVSDQLVIARWLLRRVGEQSGVEPRLDPKPVKGDWNGAGNHTNFSTANMRDKTTGLMAIRNAVAQLSMRHEAHITGYGAGLADRLTGQHETCSIHEFKSGVADRGASIRIPRSVELTGAGYLEDRRPGANCDPYNVCSLLIETICGASVATPVLN
jgi:glutamine synthetase